MIVCNPAEYNGKVILGVGAHPDDMDFTASGTFANLVKNGATAYYLVLSDGGKGTGDRQLSSAELTKIRQTEQQKACDILGVKQVYFLDYIDGCIKYDDDLKRDIVRYIRKLKPHAVFAFDPSMLYTTKSELISVNHSDHRFVGLATMDSFFPLAGNHLCMPELLDAGLEPHTSESLFLVNLNESNCAFDITDTLPQKLAALEAHASQIGDVARVNRLVTETAANEGAEYGVRHAESFMRIDIR